VLCYIGASAACLIAWLSERRQRDPRDRGIWPTLWLWTAGLLALFALIRLLEAQNWITEFGRSEARDTGFYEGRRIMQAAAIGILCMAWLLAIVTAVWRVPERRRRYLPLIVIVVCLMGFAAVRAVSLHQLDTLLYHRELVGAQYVVWGDVTLTTLLSLVALWRSMPPTRRIHSSGQATWQVRRRFRP